MATIRFFKHYIRVPYLMLGIFEFLILLAAVYAAAHLRYFDHIQHISRYIGPLLPRALTFASFMILAMIAMGLYQSQLREGLPGILLRLSVSFIVGTVGLSILFYLFPAIFFGRGVLSIALFISFIGISAARAVFLQVVDESLLKRRVLVLGAGERADHFSRLRRRSDQRGFQILGFIHIQGEKDAVDSSRIIQLDRPLVEKCLELEVDEIVVAVNDRRKNFPVHELLDCKLNGIDVVDALTFFERETGKVMLELLSPSWLIFSDGFGRSSLRSTLERGFDITISAIILIFVWPLLAITMLAILIEDGFRAPILYRQVRVGQEGKPFQVLKLRSMSVNAEKDGAQWAQKNDSRVTRVGSIIRKLRIDELPQIYNILRGDMSFVGPRPERPEFVTHLSESIPYYDERHRVKPGLAGWAQLNYPYGSSDKDAAEKLQFDLYYVKNHSLILDLLIIIQTVEVVLFGKGAR